MATTADVARMRAIIDRFTRYGLRVNTVAGWETRGKDWTRVPIGLFVHHDASTLKSGETGSLGVIVAGRSDVPGPLAQFQGHRCLKGADPTVTVVAAGRANHAGKGGPYTVSGRTVPQDQGNYWFYGLEVANDGLGESYTDACMYMRHAVALSVLEVVS